MENRRLEDAAYAITDESDAEVAAVDTAETGRHARRNHRQRVHFSVQELQKYYHLPLKTAARALGICEAALKRICRRNKIQKWPYRRLQSVLRRIDETAHHGEALQAVNNGTVTDDFLLPHEVERQRKLREELQSSQAQDHRTKKLEELKKEKIKIIRSAHHARSAEATRHEKRESDCDFEPTSMMVDAIDLDSPLTLLANLCVDEIAKTSTQDSPEFSSVRILCLMTEMPL